ncbi:MAG: sulfotransferase family protein [Moorea sp. SIO2I5]|nr:sulfotransferase family protein [Moorena sp. SIO2I5]
MNINLPKNHFKEQSKIIALWGAPRCVTTAFEKTFSQRPDTEIFHEPFSDTYYFSKWRRSNRFGDYRDKLNHDCATVIKEIQLKAQVMPIVFVKDFPFQVLPYLDENIQEFLGSVINTFIIRHPHEVLASLYKTKQKLIEQGFDPKFTEEEFGFNSLYKMFQIVTKELRQQPIVVEANRFRQNPKKILINYCQQIEITFTPKMLTWENGRLKQWNPHEAKIHDCYHETLNNTTQINPPKEINLQIRSEHLDMV